MTAEPTGSATLAACWWHGCESEPTLRFLVDSPLFRLFGLLGGGRIQDIAVCPQHAEMLNLTRKAGALPGGTDE